MEPKEELILERAKKLFLRYGYKKTSIDEIAEAAGIGKGTVYNYFKNKEQLFNHVIKRIKAELIQFLDEETNKLERADEKLIAIPLSLVRFVSILSKEYSSSREVFKELISVGLDLHGAFIEIDDRLLSVLRLGADQGIFKSGDHLKNSDLISLVSNTFFVRWVVIDQQIAEKEIKDIYELILNGLRR